MVELVAFIGIFISVLIRTLMPAMRKMLEAPPEERFKWDHRYTATAVLSVFTSLLVVVMAFPQFTPSSVGEFFIFIEAMSFSMGLNSLINEAPQWLGTPGPLHG